MFENSSSENVKIFKQIFTLLDMLLSVPPRDVTISTEPERLLEGQQTKLKCKVGHLKPVRSLEIKLFNGTTQLPGNDFQQGFNDDGLSQFAAQEFNVTFSR